MRAIEFREATVEDVPALCALRKAQLIDEGIESSMDIDRELDAFFRDFLRAKDLFEVLGVYEGKVVATAAVIFYRYPPTYTNQSGKIGYVTNMYTDPAFRGQGVATRMLGLLEAEAARRGVSVLRLGASKLGRPMYEKNGYRQDGEWMSKRL